jgi:hypothetical protein
MAARENPFPYPLQSLTDLPEHFQQAVQQVLKPGEAVISILLLPPQPFLGHDGIPLQALLSTSRGLLHLQEMASSGQLPNVTYVPGGTLLYAHCSLILLYGRLELVSEVDGSLVRMVVEYNTVGEYLLEAVLKQFLRFTYGWSEFEKSFDPQSKPLLETLEKKTFKFMNGLRLHALQPQEKLLGYVFQPRITQPFLHFFHRPIAPASLVALTDQAVILIEEDKARGPAYGWIVTLCPRKYVTEIECSPSKEWQVGRVHLQKNGMTEVRKLTLDNETALAWEALWADRDQYATPLQLESNSSGSVIR